MMQAKVVLGLFLVFGALTGCGDSSKASDKTVVVSFYPLEEAVSRIAGATVDTQNLTPPGVEPHDIELKPSDIDTIEAAPLTFNRH